MSATTAARHGTVQSFGVFGGGGSVLIALQNYTCDGVYRRGPQMSACVQAQSVLGVSSLTVPYCLIINPFDGLIKDLGSAELGGTY